MVCLGGVFHARLLRLQSEHVLLPSSFTRFLSVVRFCSARSAAGLGRRDMVGLCARKNVGVEESQYGVVAIWDGKAEYYCTRVKVVGWNGCDVGC